MTETERREFLESLKNTASLFSRGERVVNDSYGKVHIEDVAETLQRVGEQYDELQEQVKELTQKLREFKDEVYKDEELKAMKEAYDRMQDDYYRGFPISKKEQEKINTWIRKHESLRHGGYPAYHGASGGGYSYRFYPTGIGTSGEIVCEGCRMRAMRDSLGARDEYKRLLEENDAVYEFQELG